MSWFTFYEITGASVPTPATNQASIFINSATGQPSWKDDAGTVTTLVGAPGANGQGVPIGGTAAQVLSKIDGADYNTQWVTPAAGTPAGSTTQVQYNNAGAFGAEAAFAYDAATNTLTVDNITTAGLALTAATTTSSAGLRVPHGTAPTTPTNGDVWTTTAGMYVCVNGVTVGPLGTGGGGGLTNWTEAVNTSAPNATVPVVSFLATNAASNVDAALLPKGSGAILADIPDNTAAGGNKRGTGAVDFQMNRSINTEVASGNRSFIGAGNRNIASNDETAAVAGLQNTASGTYAFVGAGTLNTASGAAAGVISGQSCTASGAQAVVAGGHTNTADAQYSWCAGGFKGLVRGIIGAGVRGSGGFNRVNGDMQDRVFLLSHRSTNATQGTATTNNGAASTNNQVVLPNNSCFVVKGTINCRENATGDSSAWEFTAFIKRGASAATTAMVAACTPTLIAQDAGAATWVVAVDADTTNGSLRCRVTGAAATNINWGWSIYSCNEVTD